MNLFQRIFVKFFDIFNLLSLDVVAGACAGLFFFADMMRLELSASIYLLLGMAVWSIYTFDHLLDARKIPQKALSRRHRYHQKHFRKLSLMTLLVVILGWGFALKWLSWNGLMVGGLLLSGIILVVIIGLRYAPARLSVLKEASIAFLYVGGIALVPIWQQDFGFGSYAWLFYLPGYFILAWYNLVFLSYLDAALDKAQGHQSIMTVLGKKKTRLLLWGLTALALIYMLVLFFALPSFYHRYTLIWGIMVLVHAISFMEHPANIAQARKRLELSFSLPFLLILLG
ncbi:hypothetical protein SAMN04488057_102469 [Cyclobacterium lianum]|uniref:UbiA prenyltransferase family protein n=1 Tax=Cyclobacterium lianum TaxID=388280 RepID=A0A1M7KHI2_9BACT|nr:hypothetical protein [Cyclobacterium lianum]SHM64786.1 hypothetical protein SAMN04488057_102469 [Cyclobacterium lianum]